jgi:hypothetical protein
MSDYAAKRLVLSEITLENEIWKEIPQSNGLFQVSSLGRVFSNVSKHLLSLKPHKTYGYVITPMGNGKGNRVGYRVHRLVAEAFIANPHNKKEVNHKNKDRADNRVENLEWNTGWENTQHKYGYDVWHNSQGRIKPTHDSVARRRVEGFSKVIIPMINKLVPLNYETNG